MTESIEDVFPSPQQEERRTRLHSELEESAVSTAPDPQEQDGPPLKRARIYELDVTAFVDLPPGLLILILMKLPPPDVDRAWRAITKKNRDMLMADTSNWRAKYYHLWKYEKAYYFDYFMKGIERTRFKLAREIHSIAMSFMRVWDGETKTLHLKERFLSAIPDDIWGHPNFQKLEHIFFSDNQLTKLPRGIGELVNLETLDLSWNPLTVLPNEIGKLVKLRFLYLDDTALTVLPKEIGNLSNLEMFRLNSNRLTVLPKEVGQLAKLHTLILSNNQLTELPKEIGELVNLKYLYLYHNQLTELPKEIGQLANLLRCYLSFNYLTVLPEEIGELENLENLTLGQNQLTKLPKEIGNLEKLYTIILTENPFTDIAADVEKLSELRFLNLKEIYLDPEQRDAVERDRPLMLEMLRDIIKVRK